MLCIFLFQAEDGIRDTSVTGVQTCALPISASAQQRGYEGNTCNIRGKKPDGIERRGTEHHAVGRNTAITWFEANDATKGRRSEERRVGKECRARWSECDDRRGEQVLGDK